MAQTTTSPVTFDDIIAALPDHFEDYELVADAYEADGFFIRAARYEIHCTDGQFFVSQRPGVQSPFVQVIQAETRDLLKDFCDKGFSPAGLRAWGSRVYISLTISFCSH